MCAPLIVTCSCRPVVKTGRPTHYLVRDHLIVPCIHPGGSMCQRGQGELVEMQNPSTQCAGTMAGHSPYSQEAKTICEEALKKYAEAVYKINEKNFEKVKNPSKGWFFGLF
ncbi:hypothetical protein BST61_g9185 [Cercospora zeina]